MNLKSKLCKLCGLVLMVAMMQNVGPAQGRDPGPYSNKADWDSLKKLGPIVIAVAALAVVTLIVTVKRHSGGHSSKNQLSVQPGKLDFGKVPIGESAVRKTIFKNKGNTQIEIGSVATYGACFALSDPPQGPIMIQPGEQATVSVVFTPSEKKKFSGRLDSTHGTTSNGPARIVSVLLAGTGSPVR